MTKQSLVLLGTSQSLQDTPPPCPDEEWKDCDIYSPTSLCWWLKAAWGMSPFYHLKTPLWMQEYSLASRKSLMKTCTCLKEVVGIVDAKDLCSAILSVMAETIWHVWHKNLWDTWILSARSEEEKSDWSQWKQFFLASLINSIDILEKRNYELM